METHFKGQRCGQDVVNSVPFLYTSRLDHGWGLFLPPIKKWEYEIEMVYDGLLIGLPHIITDFRGDYIYIHIYIYILLDSDVLWDVRLKNSR